MVFTTVDKVHVKAVFPPSVLSTAFIGSWVVVFGSRNVAFVSRAFDTTLKVVWLPTTTGLAVILSVGA